MSGPHVPTAKSWVPKASSQKLLFNNRLTRAWVSADTRGRRLTAGVRRGTETTRGGARRTR